MAVPFTLQDLQYRAGQDGVNLRLDDDPTNGLSAVQDDSKADIDYYLNERYDSDAGDYLTNKWVKAALVVRGIYLLCERRMNDVPASIARRWEDLEKKLADIADGRRKVPGLTLRKAARPVLSNLRPRLWPYPQALVQRQHSTGTPTGYTRHDDGLEPPPVS